ncbi:hypothetical protein [Myxococcus llanfairpwllgwyngyllgogerychwyrndrobwllllantysiliogogogochensis]|nr:hypothetical protein [Myxococcus llanfairpwllgwyngyllgogerychwyrndrobwllllantysiliogogogochensis]
MAFVALPAAAQEGLVGGLPGLPLVEKEGGWARYEIVSPEGSTRFVVKVGAPGRKLDKAGRWMTLEVEVPSAGRVAIELLVAEGRFGPVNIVQMRLTLPGKKAREILDPFKNDTKSRREGKFLQKTTETVAGKTLEVLEYTFSGGITAEWSAAVPGLGLVRMGGENPFHLVDFGVGGDPWKERTTPAMFPAPPSKK